MATDKEGSYILAVTQKGYGKKSALEEYRLTSRGAKGVKTIQITDKNGPLVAVKAVNGDEDLLIVTDEGIIIRINLEKVGVYGRNTQGVKLITVDENNGVSMAAVVQRDEESVTQDPEEEIAEGLEETVDDLLLESDENNDEIVEETEIEAILE
jgi:DNA gyrase subunit A